MPSASTSQNTTGNASEPLRVLVAGVGNELRQDDAFGIEVIHRLRERDLPPGVTILEMGIAGIRLVQELMVGYDALILLDAVEREGEPGQLYWLVPDVPDPREFEFDQRNEFLADMHYTSPTRAMMLAKALEILPEKTYILGCQAVLYDDFDIGMSAEVEAAIPEAMTRLLAWIADLNQADSAERSSP